jgi:predicted methyltransferase
MRLTALLALVLLPAACGGSAQPSVPPNLVLPIPPEARPEHHAAVQSEAPPPVEHHHAAEPERPQTVKFPVPKDVQAIIDAADRSPDDKKLDDGRHPGELLAFLNLKPGMRVGEIESGGGYTTELLARAVGPKGKVWGENPAFVLKFVDKAWAARLAKPVMKNVIRADRDLEAPLPADAKNLDAVVDVLFYHDTVWLGADRDKMNKAVFDALKHGGEYVVVDHSATEGRGTADAKSLHRIDELAVIREVERAGFHHVASADFLRNPGDTRDWNGSPREAGERRGTTDRFVLKFIKP